MDTILEILFKYKQDFRDQDYIDIYQALSEVYKRNQNETTYLSTMKIITDITIENSDMNDMTTIESESVDIIESEQSITIDKSEFKKLIQSYLFSMTQGVSQTEIIELNIETLNLVSHTQDI
jgi:hypothetical protein